MPASPPQRVGLVCLFALATLTNRAGGQAAVERSPNVSGDWTGLPGTFYFHFLHRFTDGPAPARKVTSSPTFLVAAGLAAHTMLGVNYATNSDVAASYPNEWELFARYAPLARGRGSPVDVAFQGGYNFAAESFDAEGTLGATVGPFGLRAAARVLSDALQSGETRTVLAGSGVWRLNRFIALAGDYASMIDRPAEIDAAWGAAVQIAIPSTPHTLSLQYTNTSTGTLQGSSAARGDTRRYGFEFTIPINVRRYVGRSSSRPASTTTTTSGTAVMLRDNTFIPDSIEVAAGTSVVWTNEGTRAHTVTADDGSWDSGDIAPGAFWRHTFDRPGTYRIHCRPHESMRAVVIVR